MNCRVLISLVLAVVLGGCTVQLAKDDLILTNRVTAARQLSLPQNPAQNADLGPGTRVVPAELPAPFGTLHTVLVESSNERPLVVFCGGNGFREESLGGKMAPLLAPFGDVLFFDYPGYGASTGEGTRAEFAAAEAAVAARVKEIMAARPGRPVIYWGHSLGGGVCASLAAAAPAPSALVLAATFAQYGDVKDSMLGWFSGLVTVKVSDDTVAYDIPALLKTYRGPVVVAALTQDETIPFAASRQLADRLTAEGLAVAFVRLEGTGHSRIHAHPEFRARVKAVLAAHGINTGP